MLLKPSERRKSSEVGSFKKGIAARVLEYANELLAASYEVDPGPDLDGDGQSDWYLPRLADDGRFRRKYLTVLNHLRVR